MKRVLLVYKSNTGFTKKYAQWIQQELKCRTIALKDADVSEIAEYDVIIFGGGMHANKINGIKFIKNNLEKLKNRHLIIFATGATPVSAVEEVKQFQQANIPTGYDIPFFYFQSGMNYKDMGTVDKIVMKGFNIVLKSKKDKNAVEQGTMDAISGSYDHSKQEDIIPLIHRVKKLLE